jgi:hypothetical protein
LRLKANSGNATPSGNVVLEASPGTTIPQNAPLTLADGSASASLTNLPGGTYELTAAYGGDGSFAASTSAPVALTVTPEASNTTLQGQYVYISTPTTSPINSSKQIANGGQAPFGSTWSFTATPSGEAANMQGLAAGTAAFTDGGNTVMVPLNDKGTATWRPQNLAIGAHSVTVNYLGDASYQPSTSAALAFTVIKGSSLFRALPEILPAAITFNGTTIADTYQAGSSLIVHVLLEGDDADVPPTGTVTVNLGPLTQTVTLTANSYLNENLSTAFVTFSNVPASTYTLSASYSGDTNWNAETYTDPSQLTYADLGASATVTTLTATPATVDSSGSVTFKVSVQAASSQSNALDGGATLLANGTAFAGVALSGDSGLTASGSVNVPASAIPYGTLQVVAVYSGNIGYEPSVSNAVPLAVGATDFTLSVARSLFQSGNEPEGSV